MTRTRMAAGISDGHIVTYDSSAWEAGVYIIRTPSATFKLVK